MASAEIRLLPTMLRQMPVLAQSQTTLDAVTVTAQSTSNQGVPVVTQNGQMVPDQFSPTGNLMSPVEDLSAIVVTGRRIGATYSTLLNSQS